MRPAAMLLLILALLLLGGGRQLFEVSLAPMQQIFAWVAPELRMLQLQAQGEQALPNLHLMVTLARPTQVGEVWMQPHPLGIATATLPLGQLLQGPALLLGLVMAWPGSWRATAQRLLLALPLGVALWLADAPLVLGGLIWGLMLDAHAPGGHTWLTQAGDFLQGGGRLALATALGLAVITLLRERP